MNRLSFLTILFLTTLAWGRHDFWEFAPKTADTPTQNAPAAKPAETGWSWNSIKSRMVTKLNQVMGWEDQKQQPNQNQLAQTGTQSPSQNQTAGSAQAGSEQAQMHTSTGTTTVMMPVAPVATRPVVNKAQMKEAAENIKEIKVARIAKPAVKTQDPKLSMDKKSQIPVFDFKKWSLLRQTKGMSVGKVPLLKLGTEAELDDSTFAVIPIEPLPSVPQENITALPSPEVMSSKETAKLTDQKLAKVMPAEKIQIPALKAKEKVSRESLDKLVYTTEPDNTISLMPVVEISAEQIKLVKGLILFEKADQCHIASGLFADLVDSKDKRISEKSRYHLGYCLVEMSLPLEATHHLAIVIRSKNHDYTTPSLKRIVDDVPVYLEPQVAETILTAEDNDIPAEARDKANYIKAKYFLKKGQPQKAVTYADKVAKTSDKYFKAQYVASVGEYEAKEIDKSITRQKALAEDLRKRNTDKEVMALVQLNLARMNFQKGKYKESLTYFQQVPKEHPLWLQGLTEQAWAQLQSKDAAGAIGNMHSIQSPYFKNVYKPESYIVRSIGYLNICQYGDSYKSLAYLEHTYGAWLKAMEPFDKKADGKMMYETVLKYLQGKATQDVDGVPFQVLREVARQRDFLNAQDAVNHLIDESGAYGFLKTLIAKDKRALAIRKTEAQRRVGDLNAKIASVAKIPNGAKNLNTWKYELANNKDFLSVYEFKLATMMEGEKGLMDLSKKSVPRLDQMKSTQRSTAGKILKTHYARLIKELKNTFENNELLKYEIYAGSGENLRYKIAGGKTGGPSKMNANREPAGEKWDFDGEYWEDEIGNYRSSLKNNCQNTGH